MLDRVNINDKGENLTARLANKGIKHKEPPKTQGTRLRVATRRFKAVSDIYGAADQPLFAFDN